MKKKNIIKTICAGALVCLSSLMFAGCTGSADIDVLENKIIQLEEKIERLESSTSETPEIPETPENTTITINSNEDAYNALMQSMIKTFFNEDGNFRDFKSTFRYKMANELEWKVGSEMYYGTLSNGVTYCYRYNEWDNGNAYTHYLEYSDKTGTYSFSVECSTDATELEINKRQISSSSFKDSYVDSSSLVDYNIISYTKLENGNYEIVYEYIYASIHSDEIYLKKNVSTVVVDEKGLLLSNATKTYYSTIDKVTGEQSSYLLLDESYTENIYNVETSQKIYELFAMAESTTLTTDE